MCGAVAPPAVSSSGVFTQGVILRPLPLHSRSGKEKKNFFVSKESTAAILSWLGIRISVQHWFLRRNRASLPRYDSVLPPENEILTPPRRHFVRKNGNWLGGRRTETLRISDFPFRVRRFSPVAVREQDCLPWASGNHTVTFEVICRNTAFLCNCAFLWSFARFLHEEIWRHAKWVLWTSRNYDVFPGIQQST